LPLLPSLFKKRDCVTSQGEDHLCFDLCFRLVAVFKERKRPSGGSKDFSDLFFRTKFAGKPLAFFG
jgi:hypothetical protein